MTLTPASHVIRLRGPWQYEPLERLALAGDGSVVRAGGELPPAGELTMPSDWASTLGADFRGRVRYVRRFGRPTGLDASLRVWLVLGGVDLTAECLLNGEPLGSAMLYERPARFDVTERLAERNELAVDVTLPPLDYRCEQQQRPARAGLAGGLFDEVRLEIEPVGCGGAG